MSLKDAAQREAVLKAVLDQVKAAYDEAKEETQQQLDAEKKANGTTNITVELPGGVPLASVGRSDPKPTAVVVDAGAFLAWVRDNYPGEIERRFVTAVRPAFEKRVLAEMTAAKVPRLVDKETGQLHEVPGVEVKATRSAYHSVRLADDALLAIAAAWREGHLQHLTLPQLMAGSGDSA